MPKALITIALLCAVLATHPALAQDFAGQVTRIQGLAVASSEGGQRTLTLAAPVFAGESIRTAPKARLELTLTDGGVLTLSEATEFRIDEFVYSPGSDGGRALFHLAVGAFRSVTGRLTQVVAPDFTVQTPLAAIGIRGTDFWGGFFQADTLDVFLVSGKNVRIENAAGLTTLTEAGQGTTVPVPGQPPSPPKFWPQAKVQRALATVTFDQKPSGK